MIGHKNKDRDILNQAYLLSINKVSKVLGIRYESAKKLISSGKIKSVTINNRVKIPFYNIINFINHEDNPEEKSGIISLEETQNKIDSLMKEYLE